MSNFDPVEPPTGDARFNVRLMMGGLLIVVCGIMIFQDSIVIKVLSLIPAIAALAVFVFAVKNADFD